MSDTVTAVDPEAYARYKADLAKKLAALTPQDRADVKVREEEAREQGAGPKAPRRSRRSQSVTSPRKRRRRSSSSTAASETTPTSTPADGSGTTIPPESAATAASPTPTFSGGATRSSGRSRRKRPSISDATTLPTVPNDGQSGIPASAPQAPAQASNPTPTVAVPDNPELLEAD